MDATRDDRLRAQLGSPRGFALAAALLIAGLAAVLFTNLAGEPRGRISERRCMAVVKTMVQTGDWLVPYLGGKPRLAKPPLFYWTGASAATLLGDTGPIAVRLPSAIAAIALLALLIHWGRTLGGPVEGLAAGAAFVAMLQVATSGRRGDAEMLLALFCTAALFAFDRLYARRRTVDFVGFGALGGLAFLTKATAVLLTVAGPIVVFLALRRELREAASKRPLLALAIATAIGLSWYAAILALVPGAWDSFVGDLLLPLGNEASKGDSRHFRSPLWYFSMLPTRAAPAGLLLPFVIWRLWTTRLHRGDPRRRLAALAFVVPFVAFSLLPQKQKHYTLAMLPGLALCTADALLALAPRVRLWLTRVAGSAAALGALGALVVFALFYLWLVGLPATVVAVAAGGLGALLVAALVYALWGRALAFACAFVPALLLVVAIARGGVMVRVAQFREGGANALTVEERERILNAARAHPDFVSLFQLTDGDGSD